MTRFHYSEGQYLSFSAFQVLPSHDVVSPDPLFRPNLRQSKCQPIITKAEKADKTDWGTHLD